ncbi:MAG: hypothetical protein CMC04_04550 [Flavobacteriaceae bacterium]|nr:hypothetical protein [Flavobacteriaceae bacterium]
MIYLHENGVTVVANNEAKRGKVYELNGEKYYVARGVADINRIVESGDFSLDRVVTSKLTSLNYLFQIRGGYDQAAVPANFNDDITNWDTSNVLSMEEVFSGWPTFNQDISKWDTSKVESMYGMFKSSKYKGSYYLGNTSFNQDISNWDVSNVKNMSEMFLGASSFNKDISNWDVSNVENMAHMFSGAVSFNQDINNWDVSNVKNMAHMFSNINSIGIVAFVGSLEYTRADSTSFNQDISSWDVSNVNDMSGMFNGATSFNQPIGSWDISNLNAINGMFSGAISFNQDIGNWNVSNLASLCDMFSNSTSFNQDISNWDVSNVKNMSEMFNGATSFNQPIGNWDISNVNNIDGMFWGATSFNQDLNAWNVSSLSELRNVFYGATSFNSDIGKWNVKSVTDMENMFREASAFNIDISSWDVSNVTQMKGLFQDATSFNQNLSNWKLNVKLPKSRTMFKDAKSFNIKEYNPFNNTGLNIPVVKIKKENIAKELSAEDKKLFSKIKKLLVARDYEKIDLALELLISLNNIELFQTLLKNCKIISVDDNYGNKNLSIEKNDFFTGSGPAQPFLDYALNKIIFNVPENTNIDDSLKLDKITSLDSALFVAFPPLSKFSSLNSLKINMKDLSEDLNFDELFVNKNVVDLEIVPAHNLNWLKNFKQLKSLTFNNYITYGGSSLSLDQYENIKFLENLEYLKFSCHNISNINFLENCANIQKLDLTILSNYDDTVKLENLDFLPKLQQLEELVVSGLASSYVDISLEALKNCSQIKILTLDIGEQAANQLKFLNKCKSLKVLNLTSYKNFNLFGKISTIQMLSGLKSLKSICVGNLGKYATVEDLSEGNQHGVMPFNFSGINDSLMTDLELKKIDTSNLNGDKLRVSENQLSKIDGCFYYEGLAYNGEVFKELNGHVLYEYSTKEGLPSGIYREFYYGSDKIKMEQEFDGYKLSNHQLLTLFDTSGRNVLEDKQIVHSAKLLLSENKLLNNGKLYSGYTLLELTHTANSNNNNNIKLGFSCDDVMGYDAIKVHFNMSLSNILDKSEIIFNYGLFKNPDHIYKYLINKVSFILKIENGIIGEQISIISNDNSFIGKMSNYSDSNLNEIEFISESSKVIDDLNDKAVVISGVFEKYSRNELKEIIEINNGKISSSISKNTSFILAGDKMGPKKKLLANDLGIDIINEKEFIDKYINSTSSTSSTSESSSIYSFFYNGNNTNSSLEKSKLSADDKKVLSEVKKNLLSRDYNLIDDGIKKLSSLNNHLLFENLLDGCSISETEPNYFELNTNKNFTGSGPAQPYLNYALFQVLANLPTEANVVSSLQINQRSYLDTKVFSFNELYSQFISLDKFSHLEYLKIDFKIFEIMNEGANPEMTRENWFKNSNLKKLDISNFSGSFKFLKNLKDLEYLSLEFGFYKYEFIEHFEFLENIKTLNLTKINYSSYNETLTNLDFLKKLKKIKSLNITLDEGYRSSKNVENLDVIKNFNALETLVLRGIPAEINLDFLLDCKGLKFLILDFNKNKETIINLECLRNCSLLEKLILNNIGELNIEGKISDINQLNGLENLRTLKIEDIIISGINDKVFIK